MLGKISDRHVLAELKLPELQERCAIATNKNLYKLSQQLAEPEPIESGNDTEVPSQQASVQQEIPEQKVHRKLHKMPWRRNDHTDNESEHRRRVKEKASRKLQSNSSMDSKAIGDATSSMQQVIKEKRAKKKAKRKKAPPGSSDGGEFTTAANVVEEAAPAPPSPKECRAEVSPTKLESIHCNEMQQRQLISEWSELTQPQSAPQLNIDSIIYRFLYEKFQQVLQFMKHVAKKIGECDTVRMRNEFLTLPLTDDWHAFTLLLFVGTFGYLLYILFYDINEYINEERRYRQKMKDSRFVLRCFFYLMRLLKVRIF